MRFHLFEFRGFKSLRDVSLDLDQVTVVTGPNGAGKTNLVEALSFFSEAVQYGLEIAIARAGGFENITHHSNGDNQKSIGCTFVATFHLSEIFGRRPYIVDRAGELSSVINMAYDFTVIQRDDSDPSSFKIEFEYLELRDEPGLIFKATRTGESPPKFFRSKRMKGGRRGPLSAALYPLSDDDFIKYTRERIDDTTLLVRGLDFSTNVFDLIARQLGQTKVFQLSPQQCRQPGVSTPNALLSRYGENLPSVVDYLRKNRPEPWTQIEAAMRAVLPQLEVIETTFTQDRRLSLSFKFSDSDRNWNANEMSDGTVQALALFVALFDERSPVLVVEEPENALHPWILRHFLDLCRGQSKKQILLTTHSPVVIDYTAPENLRIMWSRDGSSHLSLATDLNPEIVTLWKSGEVRSFDIFDSGMVHEYLPEEYVPEEPNE
ncbi:AAA family ATPase [Mycobacterium sp. SMC-19]|uniref:AAA family ATPase n=1 Tax=Mycobacterium sp. SMC-19 TaxID=3381630 RepID=UPI0038772BCA